MMPTLRRVEPAEKWFVRTRASLLVTLQVCVADT